MGKKEELQKLFENTFIVDLKENNGYWGKLCVFKCTNGGEQGVCKTESLEVKRTCAPGEEKSKVLILGEAPSSGKGTKKRVGAKTSMLFSNITDDNQSPQYLLREVILKQYGSIPFFTDYVKCGVLSQKNDKHKLDVRKEPCFNKFLLEEIKIIQPEVILCCEINVFWFLVKKIKKLINLLNNFELIHIYHYTTNQNWNKLYNELSKQKKESMESVKKKIWKMQIEGKKNENLKFYRYRKIIVQNGEINIDCSSHSSSRKINKLIQYSIYQEL